MAIKPIKLNQSRTMLKQCDKLIIRGCQVHKDLHNLLEKGYPVFTQRAQGARFWDVDGNEYLDYLMGYGPIVLGHNDSVLGAAIREQIQDGTIYNMPHPKQLEVAEMLIDAIPAAEMVGFFIGGSAVTSSALRLARAFTQRDKIIRCGYHGWYDWARAGDVGVPASAGELTLTVPYGDLEALEDLFRKHDNQIACVIMEAVQGDEPPEGLLQGCIDMAHQHGALCILDEVKTGFRLAFGGAAQHYGVSPDLSTFGKACCNGYPGSFVSGRREILSNTRCQSTWMSATFHCDPLSMVALEYVTKELNRRDGIAHQWKLGNRLIAGVNQACEAAGLGYRLSGPGAMPNPRFPKEERDRCLGMLRGCLARGFYLHPTHPMFLTLSHSARDIDDTIIAVQESIADLDA